MKVNSFTSQNFGICVVNVPPTYYQQVPAIIRHVNMGKVQSATSKIPQVPSLIANSLPKHNHNSDIFVLHEAILPDNKIRIIGLKHKGHQEQIHTRKLKGAGRKNYQKVWSNR